MQHSICPERGRRGGIRTVPLFLALLVFASCGGGGGGSSGTTGEVEGLDYSSPAASYRVGEAIATNAPVTGLVVESWAVSPALPEGLAFDPGNGSISGTPTAETARADYTVTATLEDASTETVILTLAVGPQLPDVFKELDEGFAAEVIAEGLLRPVRFAVLPDGRILYNELSMGNIRVLDADGNQLPTPFATLPVMSGGEMGLLGLVLSPNFATDGYVYVSICTPAAGPDPDSLNIYRFKDDNSVGTDRTLIWSHPVVTEIHNAGELAFGADGNLFVSVGDNENPNLSQQDGAVAGKIHRITPTGGIPAGNPIPGDTEWARGFRNTFGLTVHPTTGDLFGVENGPDAVDELNYIEPGKNFEWGPLSGSLGAETGIRIATWISVIAPTDLTFHDGAGGWGDHGGDIYVTAYNDQTIHRLVMSGAASTDVDREEIFARFHLNQFANKPLGILQASDGSLYVSTFEGIYRIWAF